MATKVGMEVSIAIGEVVKAANADFVSAYPITPQTHIVEHLPLAIVECAELFALQEFNISIEDGKRGS